MAKRKRMTNREKQERAAAKKMSAGRRTDSSRQAEAEPEKVYRGGRGGMERTGSGMSDLGSVYNAGVVLHAGTRKCKGDISRSSRSREDIENCHKAA